MLSILVWLAISACAGQFETKPTLTETCQTTWQQQSGIDASILPDSTVPNGLNVLVFNIHDRLLGEPNVSKGGHTEEEVVCIADLAKPYDLVLFQEAFVRPAQIARHTQHAWADHPLFQEGGGGDWWPLRVFCEICLSPGLLMLAREEPELVLAEPYEAFAGWNTKLNKADNFFSKGLQLVKFKNFWVLNTHMDAGRGQESIEARVLQFRQITTVFKQFVPDDVPLFIGIDANLRPDREKQDEKILKEFLESNGLTLVLHNGPDLIAVRNITVENPKTLPLKSVLSDHNALSVIIYPPAVQISQH